MIPLIQIATTLLSTVGKKKVKGFEQNVKQLVTGKTSGWAIIVIGFVITQLTSNPNDHFYQGLLVFCVFMVGVRDTLEKVIAVLRTTQPQETARPPDDK
jgi:hypothetical protein